MSSIFTKFNRTLFSGLMILMFSIIAFAQFKAALQGTVTDQNGGVIPNATVILVNNETKATQQMQTSDEGFYRFSNLAPGSYSLTVEQASFKKQVFENVTVSGESVQGFDVLLSAGGVSEVVTITDEAQTVESEDANIRKTITTVEVRSLPQPGRDPYELARLAPGVFGTGARGAGGGSVNLPNTAGPGGSSDSIFATENVQPITANGQRVSSNNYQIDGTSVNSQTWGGGAVITPSQESVKELVVTSSTYSAEDGRNSGAQVKVVTQNGTNDWHGSAFFKINDPSLNAYNKMPRTIGELRTAGPQRVERKFKTYGGSLGGPIVSNRLFFFFTYEGLRENTSNTYNAIIDTAAYRQAVIAARPNTLSARILGATGVEPRVVSILTPNCNQVFVPCQVVGDGLDVGSIAGSYGTYLDPWTTGGGLDGIADLQYAQLVNPRTYRAHQFNTRIDYQMTDKDKFTSSIFIVPSRALAADPSAQSRPQADVNSKRMSYAVGLIYNRIIGATMTNEARFNITKWGFDETKTNPDADLGLPRIEIEAIYGDRLRYGFPRGPNTPGIIGETQLDFRDTFTSVVGNHVLKFGGEYRRDLNNNGEAGGARPKYSFLQQWNFANGTPIYEEIITDLNGKPAPSNTKFHTSELAFFAQDDWKVIPSLTLNLGLRWSYYSPVTGSNGVLGNLLLGADGGLADAKIITNKQLYKKDLNNFAPQIGFAWSPVRFENKLVIRGGGGLGYDRLPNALLANARRNPPNAANFGGGLCCAGPWDPFLSGRIAFVGSTDGTLFGYPANPLLGAGTNPANGLPNSGAIEIYGTPQDLPTAYVMRYSLEGQYELPAKMIGTLGYQGSAGRHFVRILPLHFMTPSSNPNLGSVYFASPDVNSNYNAMIARLQGRLANQFTFDTNYRWSKSIDTASYEAPTAFTNQSFPVDQREERGPSDFDVRHSFVASGIWDIPYIKNPWGRGLLGDWQISSIVTWNSGFPWTPRIYGCLRGATSSSRDFCDPRPTSYDSTQPDSNTNANFLRPYGIFGEPGTSIFGTNFDTSDPFRNRPAIGRNILRGPRYFNVDLTVAKKFRFGSTGFMGENAALDLRFNFFNIFNTLNLTPFNALSDNVRVQSLAFGTATSGLAGRVGEFQIRFSF